MPERIGWGKLWMDMATLVGQRSQCSRAQYGAVIVSEDNRILSVGYNGPPAGKQNDGPCNLWCPRAMNAQVDPNYLDCDAVHAEVNAILRAPNLWTEQSPTLYVNAVTCHRCALTVAASGVKSIAMAVNEFEEKRDPFGTAAFLIKYGIAVEMMRHDAPR
jgi:dCMP deaminase